MLHQPDSTVHCRTTPSSTALLMKGESFFNLETVRHPVHKSTSCDDVTCQQPHTECAGMSHRVWFVMTSVVSALPLTGTNEGWSSEPDNMSQHTGWSCTTDRH